MLSFDKLVVLISNSSFIGRSGMNLAERKFLERALFLPGQHDRQRVVAQDMVVIESRCSVDAN